MAAQRFQVQLKHDKRDKAHVAQIRYAVPGSESYLTINRSDLPKWYHSTLARCTHATDMPPQVPCQKSTGIPVP